MGTVMKLVFIILIIVVSSLNNSDITSEEISTKGLLTVEQQNRIFMIHYFEGDTANALKYLEKVEHDSLKEIILVSLSKQELYVLEFNHYFNVKFQTLVSGGKKEGWTPKGEFTIIGKLKTCPSIEYGGTMYKWNGLGKKGVRPGRYAIHGLLHQKDYEKFLGQPKSHGCVRISNSVADSFYRQTYVGLKVVII